jgi:hypothetical protein
MIEITKVINGYNNLVKKLVEPIIVPENKGNINARIIRGSWAKKFCLLWLKLKTKIGGIN